MEESPSEFSGLFLSDCGIEQTGPREATTGKTTA